MAEKTYKAENSNEHDHDTSSDIMSLNYGTKSNIHKNVIKMTYFIYVKRHSVESLRQNNPHKRIKMKLYSISRTADNRPQATVEILTKHDKEISRC